MQSPRRIFLDTNVTCNLRCIQCDIHRLRAPENELSTEERLNVVRQLGAWDRKIRLLLSGGEPFLRRREIYALASEAKTHGIHLSLNTHGALILPADLEKLPHSGVRTLVFSLDHPLAAEHDRIRGVPGTFARATRNLQLLRAENKKQKGKCAVLLTSILGGHNLDHLRELVDLSDQLGADGIIFQPIQPVFEREVKQNWWEDTPLWPSGEFQVRRGFETLRKLKSEKRRILQSASQIDDMEAFLLDPGSVPPGQCISMEENLMIDATGEVRLCFSQDRLELPPVGNVREEPLREIWERSQVTREKMRGCALECSTMLCHSR